jgi:hypothetical protein
VTGAPAALPRVHRAALVALPWLFLAVFAWAFLALVWPRALDGHVIALLVSGVMALGFVCSSAAAVTFSRDVLLGRYPGSDA